MKKLDKKTKSFLLSLGCVMLSAFSVGAVLTVGGCGGDEDEQTPATYTSDGSYYSSAVDGEYALSMSLGQCTLTIGNDTKFGTYEENGNAVSFMFEDGTSATATVANGNVTLVYKDATLVFLKKVDYTVSYSVDGAVASTAKVLNGKTVSRPADPVKDGYIFIGWYEDAEYTTAFAFDTAPVLGDTTLYARFVAATVGQNEYKVTYVVDGEKVGQQATKGGVVYDMPTPTKENATFVGWWVSDYQDSTKLTCKYSGQVLAENTNLYAVWSDAKLQVSVNENGVKWNALGAGTTFTVSVYYNGTKVAEQKTSSVEYAYDFTTKSAGNYEVKVSANNETATAYYQNKALDRVSLFTVAEPSVLVYNAVENAEKYLITIDCGNDEHAHVEIDNGTFTSFNFANCDMQEGGITFTVKAIANGYVTSVSEKFAYSRDLSAITGVAFNEEDGMLRWNPVSKATSYKVEVKVGDETDVHEVYGTSFSLAQYTGAVSVKVYAVADGYNYSSISYNYTCERLVAPTGVAMNYNTLKWNAVAGATKYNVRIGSTVYTTTGTEYALPDEYKVSGAEFDVSVQAVGATEANNSYYTKAVSVKYGVFDNVYYGNGGLNWSAVGGAYSYVVTINDNNAVDGSEKTFKAGTTFGELTFKAAGKNKVVIKALDAVDQVLSSKEVTVETSEVVFDTRTAAGVTKLYKAVGDKMDVEDPVYEGYDFAGWYNVPSPVGEANNGSKLENMVYTGSTANAFYASWSPKAFEVTLKVGDEVVDTATVYYGKKFTLTSAVKAPDAAKAFGGWYAQDNSQGQKYTNAQGVSANTWLSTNEDVTLYAGWITVLDFEEISDATVTGGKAYQVKKGAEISQVTEITIPATYNGKPVTTIAPEAFEYCSNLEVINIPDTIQYISFNQGGVNATGSSFLQCTGLKEINVKCVDGEHKEDAKHETYFSSEDGVLIRHASPNTGVLADGVELAYFPVAKTGDYTVPSGVEYIPQYVFNQCKLTSITIPATVKTVGDNAFRNSPLLEKVVFEEEAKNGEEAASTLELGENVFMLCSVLKTISFPSRLAETDFLEKNIFGSTYKVAELTVTKDANGSTAFYTSNSNMLCDKTGAVLLFCPAGATGVVTIPAKIEEIGANAFVGCNKITEVVIKDNVRKIGNNAFEKCNKLETVTMQGETGSLEIASQAFYGCPVLKDLVIPQNVTKIGANAFGNTPKLTKVTLNGGANIDYAEGAFTATTGEGYVTHLTIGKNLGAFEINGVFKGCEIQAVSEEVPGANANYVTDNGVLYSAGKTKLLFYPFGKTEETFTFDEKTKEIGAGAFFNKTNLKSMTIPATVEVIGNDAFKGATAMGTLTFDARTTNLTIGNNAFDGCASLKKVQLPEKTTAVGNSAFNACVSLESVEIPVSLTSLGDNVFASCSKLAAVTVLSGNTAFAAKSGILYTVEDDKLTQIKFVPVKLTGEVVLSKDLKSVAASQFKSHAGITKISFEDNTTTNAEFAIGDSAFEGMSALTAIVLPNNLKTIPHYAFKNSTSLTGVQVPKTVTSIGAAAFLNASNCVITFEEGGTENLAIYSYMGTGTSTNDNSDKSYGAFYGVKAQALELPERMTEIPRAAFRQSSITKVTIPSTVQKIGKAAFGKSALTEVVFAKNAQGKRALTEVEDYAFDTCKSLTKVTVPSSITAFTITSGSYHRMFAACTALTEVTIEDGLKTIPASMFNGDSVLASVKTLKADGTVVDGLPSSIESIGMQAFMNCRVLTSAKLSDNLVTIGNSAFSSTGLTAVAIPASVVTIEASAFSSCASLATLSFAPTGSKLESIGASAFKGTKISTVNIPENVDNKEITFGAGIFENCTSLTTATVPASVKVLNNAFLSCTSLTTLNYAGAMLDAEQGLMLEKVGEGTGEAARYKIVFYTGTAETFTIPENVVEIGAGAFSGKTTLKTVNIHQGVTTIHDNAFKASGLTTVNFIETAEKPSTLTTIGASAFENTKLVELTLPASLIVKQDGGTAIGKAAFKGITTLTKVTVNGTAMGADMFYNCSSLADITLNNDIETFNGGTFRNTAITSLAFLPSKLKTVGSYEFAQCTKLTTATLPKDLVVGKSYDTPGSYMFYGCTALTTVNLNAGLKNIAGHMFENCTALESFTIIEGVEVLSTYAFAGCNALKSVSFPNSLKTIESYSFINPQSAAKYYVSIETFDISNTQVTAIPSQPIMIGNQSLKTVKLPAAVTTYSGGITNCPNIETFIAKGVTNANLSGFGTTTARPTQLKTVQLSDNLATIANNCFIGCTSLTSFPFPNTLTSIGKQAFDGAGLTSVTLGTAVTSIGDYAFRGTQISSITIPASVTSIGTGAFAGCANLAEIKVDPMNTKYRSGIYGELYDANDTLVSFPMKATGLNGYVEIEEGVTLNANAFEGIQGIQTVKLPSTLVNVPNALFKNSGVRIVMFSSGTRTLGNEVFMGCTKLERVELPDTIVSFGTNVFSGCTSLTSVKLPAYIQAIPGGMFSGCTGITEIVIPELVQTITAGAFSGWTAAQVIKVPHLTQAEATALWGSSWYGAATVVYKDTPQA